MHLSETIYRILNLSYSPSFSVESLGLFVLSVHNCVIFLLYSNQVLLLTSLSCKVLKGFYDMHICYDAIHAKVLAYNAST